MWRIRHISMQSWLPGSSPAEIKREETSLSPMKYPLFSSFSLYTNQSEYNRVPTTQVSPSVLLLPDKHCTASESRSHRPGRESATKPVQRMGSSSQSAHTSMNLSDIPETFWLIISMIQICRHFAWMMQIVSVFKGWNRRLLLPWTEDCLNPVFLIV